MCKKPIAKTVCAILFLTGLIFIAVYTKSVADYKTATYILLPARAMSSRAVPNFNSVPKT